MILIDRDRCLEWLSTRLTGKVNAIQAIGLEKDGKIIAAFAFSDWTGPDIELSVASEGSITRELLKRVAQYVFVQLNCRRATCNISVNNHKSIRFVQRNGWVLEGRRRQWCNDGSDAWMFGLLKSECKWI